MSLKSSFFTCLSATTLLCICIFVLLMLPKKFYLSGQHGGAIVDGLLPKRESRKTATHSSHQHNFSTAGNTVERRNKARDSLYWGPALDGSRDFQLAVQLRERLKLQDVPVPASADNFTIATSQLVRYRCLPNLYVFGFPKSGSTALYQFLGNHSAIVAVATKEIHYLTRKFEHRNGSFEGFRDMLDRYIMRYFHFACRKALQRKKKNKENPVKYVIEGSQSYSWQINRLDRTINNVPSFMRGIVPHAKFIAVKRDPVSRAFSEIFAFNRSVSMTNATVFTSKVRENINAMDKCFKEKPGCCCTYFPPKLLESSFPRLHISFYDCHMARWRAVYPPENILELNGYVNEKALRKVFTFLNLPVEPVWNSTVFGNENHRRHDTVNEDLKNELRAFFRRHNASELVKKHYDTNSTSTTTTGFSMPELTAFCNEPIFITTNNNSSSSRNKSSSRLTSRRSKRVPPKS